MRITFVLPFAGLVGGVRVVAIYAERLRRRGHAVVVVSTPTRPRPFRRKVRSLLTGRGWPASEANGMSYFDGLPIEHRVVKAPVTDDDVPDADVVVATWWETAAWVHALGPSKGAKAYFVQDYGAHEGQPIERVAETWRLPLYKITISRWLVELIERHTGEADVLCVPNSVDQDVFYAAPRGRQPQPTVGLMYSTRPQKGLDVMLEAIGLARKALPALRVVAYGPTQPARELPLPEGSAFHCRVPDDRLREIYSRCDAWLFGSRCEGFGLPILEAMACRTPVIATPAGAAPELVGAGGGVLVRPDDPRDMARAIERVCTMPEEEWRRMSDQAYRTATGYTWDDATERFEAALRAAAEQGTTEGRRDRGTAGQGNCKMGADDHDTRIPPSLCPSVPLSADQR